MAQNDEVRNASARSSMTVGQNDHPDVPAIPAKEKFNDDSQVPFMTARTFFMTVLVSMGGICFGYDTGQISGFLQMDE
jgi:MFS transporter, SP family, sugar:H+ symporter